ncbi:UNVERIFIED_CONTAM: hypothetical protein Sradi_6156700 [Sesamum radiatum]|uniref:Mitochondrial protein n=1 Tax=Sesamum radiatum TaxID=300843 RepID=A0AAW2K8N1_SESRA
MMEPESFEAAAKHEVWVQAMKEEIKMIEKNDTWELAERPKDKEVIGVKWIYKTKLNDKEKVERQTVMIPKETPLQQQEEEGTGQTDMERRNQQAPGSPRRPPQSEETEEETPPRRTKLLSDIYETCNFVMMEPEKL